MRYIPHTQEDVVGMLQRVGAASIDALFDDVPPRFRLQRDLALPAALDEAALMRHLDELSQRNAAASMLSFLGGGMTAHHVPPAVDQLLLRSEFYTAYTPYQAEVAQGTLQAMYEFQSMVAELFGMPLANASMYDGASAAAEAVSMARRITQRPRVLLSAGLHPHAIETVQAYSVGHASSEAAMLPNAIALTPLDAGLRTDAAALAALLRDDVAAVVVGYPNFFGTLEDLAALRRAASEAGALLITLTCEPYALAVLQPPGAYGADIAVGEGQALAVPPQFGGPGVGLFACRQEHLRQMPGRLVGETVDAAGQRGYVLALSTREQHIRRERATSNICTNHGLIALALTIRTALLGRSGFVAAGELCFRRTTYLRQRIEALPNFRVLNAGAVFNEFTVACRGRSAESVLAPLRQQGILGGIDLGTFAAERSDQFLVAVTEQHPRSDLDRLVAALASA